MFSHATGANVAVIFALALVPMTTLVGAAVDYSKASQARTSLQAALDAAALAGASAPDDDQVATATALFNADFADHLAGTATASFTPNDDGSMSAAAQVEVPTSFMKLVSVDVLPVSASAKAVRVVTKQVCILVLSPNASQALLVNSGAKIEAPDCEIDVRSTASPAAIFNSGTTLNVANICIQGTNVIKNGGADPPAQTGCTTISDPIAGTLPTVTDLTCDYTNKTYDSSTIALNPGVYCGSTNFNGSPTITFNPGLYVIKNGTMTINSNAKLSGSGVTFYYADQNSKIQFNGGVSGTLHAPTSGTYANILMFEPSGLAHSQVVFNGTQGEDLEGLIYLPSRDVTFNSVSSVSSEKMTMVVNTLILDSTDWAFGVGATTMAGSSGSQGARLVD